MNIEEFSRLFSDFKRSAFRLESLQHYRVKFEQEALERYLGGDPLPKTPPNSDWLSLVRSNIVSGKTMSRVHLIAPPLSPYLKFEIEWGYYYSVQAGEEVLLCLDASKDMFEWGDFWIFDDSIAVQMEYESSGEFIKPNLVGPDRLGEIIARKESAVKRSVRLQEYLAGQRSS